MDQQHLIEAVQERTGFDAERSQLLLATNDWDLTAALREVQLLTEGSAPDVEGGGEDKAETSAASAAEESGGAVSSTVEDPSGGSDAAAARRSSPASSSGVWAWISWAFQNGYSAAKRNALRIGHIQAFEAAYGDVHPRFFDGSFHSALVAAQRANQFVFALVHSAHHERTEPFMRNVFCTTAVQRYIDETFTCWLADVTLPEGAHMARSLGVVTYPYVAVLTRAPPQYSQAAHGATVSSVLARCDTGSMDTPDALIAWLTMVLESFDRQIERMQAETAAMQEDRLIREEQDAAYQRSLEEDREKERRAREAAEEEERRKEEERREQEAREEEERRKEEELAMKLSRLPPEPETSDDTVRLAFQLPSGERIGRRFLKHHTLEVVYDYVDTHQTCFAPGTFVVESQYPKRAHDQKGLTIEQSGLRSEVLFVTAL